MVFSVQYNLAGAITGTVMCKVAPACDNQILFDDYVDTTDMMVQVVDGVPTLVPVEPGP